MNKNSRHWSRHKTHKPRQWQWDENDRRRNFRRFFFLALIGLSILLLGAGSVIALAVRASGEDGADTRLLLLAICALPFVFMVTLSLLGRFFFRRVGYPLADMMEAADAVAQGDLSVRVPEDVPGQVGVLATRFNRMTAELDRSEQQRRNLTADVAHELRTPVHIIQGNLEGILDGVYEPDGTHIAATLEETRLLTRLVDDLQTLSLAEAGQLPLHPTTFPVADLLADVVTSFELQAAELDLIVTSQAPAELLLTADAGRLDQVLSNLVANSLRHTAVGGRVSLTGGEDDDTIVITVADDGEGVDPEDLPFIFDRFWRGDRSRTRAGSVGAGLGLAISRRLLQAHGGVITAESQPGEGSLFTITLPRQPH